VGGNQVLSTGFADEIYLKAQALRKNIMQLFTQDFKEVSVILSPVSPTLPPQIGNSLKDPLAMYLSDIYTIGFSLGELPTLTSPVGTATGIQITADKKQDELTLKFAKYLNEIL
jgi:aspartyl-tRNA(Asn)/glutamyl-tRNA(Gln) amidotransferase subunit A